MKKLNLKVANLNATEILSREELKKVLGGENTGSATCDGKTTSLKCTEKDPGGGDDVVKSSWSSVGCPSSNTCPAGQVLSCSCVL